MIHSTNGLSSTLKTRTGMKRAIPAIPVVLECFRHMHFQTCKEVSLDDMRLTNASSTEWRNENPAFFESSRSKRHSPQVSRCQLMPYSHPVNFKHFCRNVSGFDGWNNIKNYKEMIQVPVNTILQKCLSSSPQPLQASQSSVLRYA